MYVVTNRIIIAKGNGPDLEQRFGPRGGVEREPGFNGFELWRCEPDPDAETGPETEREEYLVVTHWESEDYFKAWIRSESFREAHSNMRIDYIVGPGELKRYDVRLASSPLSKEPSA